MIEEPSLLDMSLSDARALDQALFETADPDFEREIMDSLRLSDGRDQSIRHRSNDPAANLKPRGTGKKTKLQDYGPAIKKMLASNRNRSQAGPNFRADENEMLANLAMLQYVGGDT